MAFLLRRSASITRRLLHTSASSSLNLSRCSPNLFRLAPPTAFIFRRNYSDHKLLKAVDFEIDSTLSSHPHYSKGLELPGDFPFQIEEPYNTNLTLVRDYNKERITVEVEMKNDEEEETSFNEEAEANKISDLSRLVLDVRVYLVNDTLIKFRCYALPDNFTIHVIRIPMANGNDPLFSDMNEHLQKAFYEYLSKRGINMSTTNLLRKYITNYCVMNQNYVSWLKGMKHFLNTA